MTLPRPIRLKTNQIPFRTDERDEIQKMIQKYNCSPFTGKCYVDKVSFYKEKKTGLYHILLTPDHVKRFLKDDMTVPENDKTLHELMFMIRPTDEDSDYLIFKRCEEI